MDEMQLVSSYISPFMIALFNDFKDKTNAHGNNSVPDDKTADEDRRPDFISKVLDPTGRSIYINLYGEVKTYQQWRSHKDITLDLYRLDIFSKHTYDHKQGVPCILTFQAIGSFVTFYLLSYEDDEILALTELRRIYAPTCVPDVQNVILSFDTLLQILEVYDAYCFRPDQFVETNPPVVNSSTLPYDYMQALIENNSTTGGSVVVDYMRLTELDELVAGFLNA